MAEQPEAARARLEAGGGAHWIGVGGWVVRSDGRVLLARMTYGPAEGRLMIPGGRSAAGEFVDETAVREVREETGLETIPRGIVLVRQRQDLAEGPDLYLVLLLTPAGSTEPRPDGQEVSECLWLTCSEIRAREDVQPIAAELAAAWASSPMVCLGRRGLSWQGAEAYRLWSGGLTQPPEAKRGGRGPVGERPAN